MARKRFTAEQIIMKLREAEAGLAQGQTVGQVCKQIGVTEQTYYPGLCKNRSPVLKNESRSGPTRKRAGVTGGFAKNMGWRGV